MPYFVLACGLAMSVLGVISIASGYPIIQVERGWAMVIAGASLVAGGAVTTALGLVLRAVGGLRRAILGLQVAGAPQTAAFTAAAAHDVIDDVRAPGVPAIAATAGDAPDLRARAEPEIAAPQAAGPAGPLVGQGPAGKAAIDETSAQPAFAATAPADVGPPAADRRDTMPAELAAIAEPPAREAAKSPPMDDWLDRSFAEFDRENANSALHAPSESELPPDPAPDVPALPPSPTLPEPTAAVIGRYEADGTSYVMYADGSIEAQSPAGVYRFSSMAELKAFIET